MRNQDERYSTGNGCASGSIRCELRHSRTIAAATEVDSSNLEFDHAWSTRNDFRRCIHERRRPKLIPGRRRRSMLSHHDHWSIRTQVEDFASDGSNRTENPDVASFAAALQ